jgi:hypothetical protein
MMKRFKIPPLCHMISHSRSSTGKESDAIERKELKTVTLLKFILRTTIFITFSSIAGLTVKV